MHSVRQLSHMGDSLLENLAIDQLVRMVDSGLLKVGIGTHLSGQKLDMPPIRMFPQTRGPCRQPGHLRREHMGSHPRRNTADIDIKAILLVS